MGQNESHINYVAIDEDCVGGSFIKVPMTSLAGSVIVVFTGVIV